MTTPLELILALLPDAKKSGAGWSACCPAHDDRQPSLSIAEGEDGRVLLKCHAGCSLEAICEAMGLEPTDLFVASTSTVLPAGREKQEYRGQANGQEGNGKPQIVATYDYWDERGELLFQVVRYDPKDFRQRRPKPGGGWVWSVKGARVVPYRLPELLARPDEPVFVVEGEKDVDNLARIGVLATCNAGGAGKWTAEHAAFLAGRRVNATRDNDDSGLRHIEQVAHSLHGHAEWVRIVDLPGLPAKGDVSDWIAAGGTKEELMPLAESSPIWAPATSESGPVLTCLADVEPRPISWLWPQRIPMGRISLLVGRPGEGKSFLTTDMAARVTTGTPWPDGSECPQGSVILISAEDDPGDTIRPRLDAHYADLRRVHLLSAVVRFDSEGRYERMVTLADLDAIEAALERLPDCKLIIVDPVGSFLGGRTDAHRDNEVRAVLAPIAKLAEKRGPAVLVVAHRRKSPGRIADDLALGSRAFTGIARAVWHLTRDRDDRSRRLLLPGKNNLAEEGEGLAFSIIGQPPHISWERDLVTMSADEALAAENSNRGDRKPGPEATARNQAAEWLRDLLASGPMETATVKEEAKAASYAWRTLHRAKDELRVKPYRREFSGPWYWQLPAVSTCQVSSEQDILASWHDSENTEEKSVSEPGTIGTCQVGSSWHDSPPESDNRVQVTI
ncbi:MAG: AAA family ATPase [Gemmataceae bacterium]